MIAVLACMIALAGQESPQVAQAAPAAPDVLDSVKDPRHKADLQRDIELGKKYTAEVEKEYKKSENAEMIARVGKIGSEIASIALSYNAKTTWGDKRLNPLPYQFTVLKGDDVNAFSLPGGYIYVFEGLLKFVESDDELAGVLAHEISHASFRHIATMERESRKLEAITLPAILIAILAGGEAGGAVVTGVQLGTTAMGSGWSVKAEESADYGGLQYMQQSHYKPVAMLTMLEKLAQKDKVTDSIDWGILRTHPPSRDRAEAMLERFQGAGVPIRRSQVAPSFAVQMKTGDGGVELWFGKTKLATFGGDGAVDRAEQAQAKLNEFLDTVPGLFEVDADASGAVLGRRQRLFSFTGEDAASQKTALSALAKEAADGVKKAIFALNMKIWNPR